MSGFSNLKHPEYNRFSHQWEKIRDALAGEDAVKDKGTRYLPSLDSSKGEAYENYKGRATFVNMVARTAQGLVGTIFRRPLKVDKVKDEMLESVALDGMSLNLFAKNASYELISMGRVGILCDLDTKSQKPYLVRYEAENILNWSQTTVNGRKVLDYVLLQENTIESTVLNTVGARSLADVKRYRMLYLDEGVYRQRVFSLAEEYVNGNLVVSPKNVTDITPTRNGQALNFIPMEIVGPLSNTPEVQTSPLYNIVTLNYAHYRTSAQLEHGRHFSSTPIYYVPTAQGVGSGEYHIGGSSVWETMPGEKPGVLEYYGHGLRSLESSMTEKEEHIAQLGGRIMGIRPAATAESDNIFKLKQANELSILLNITDSLSGALTNVFRWYLDWQRISTKDVKVHLNQDFKSLNIASRELRAISLLYQNGILPVQEVYRVLQEGEYIADDVSLEDFIDTLKDMDNFPNQPDVTAQKDGYADAKARVVSEDKQAALDVQMQIQQNNNNMKE